MNGLSGILLNLAVFVILSVGGGLGTAWYMIESGSRLSTQTFGPWVTWSAAGRPDADPYTRAHTIRNGLLPLTSTLAVTFQAKTDSSGSRLHSGCEYAVVSDGPEPDWWTLAAFDVRGRLMANAAERYSFNSSNVMREPDGRTVITLARDPRPGNWLPVSGGRFVLMLTMQDAARAASIHEGGQPKALPEIQRVACR
jgi:hypothetical protein